MATPQFTINGKSSYSDYIDIISAVLDDLKKEDGLYSVYVGGEGDSNQTVFERRSNYAQIGVLATSQRMGNILLFLLRSLIDNSLICMEILCDMVYSEEHAEIFTLEDVLSIWEKWESMYVHSDRTGTVTSTLVKSQQTSTGQYEVVKTTIKHKWCEMELWNLKRIEVEIKEHIENMCHGVFDEKIYAEKISPVKVIRQWRT